MASSSSSAAVHAALVLAGKFDAMIDIENNAKATFESDRAMILKQIAKEMGLAEANK